MPIQRMSGFHATAIVVKRDLLHLNHHARPQMCIFQFFTGFHSTINSLNKSHASSVVIL